MRSKEVGNHQMFFRAHGVSLAAVRLSDVELELSYVLDDVEREMAKSFRLSAQRDRFVAGRIALRYHLSNLTGNTPSSLQADYSCPSCLNRTGHGHGTPRYYVPSSARTICVSLSRSGNWCLLAGGMDNGITGIGVDVETESAVDFEGFSDVAMTSRERRYLRETPSWLRTQFRLRLWVRKEAVLKALGTGLAVEPSLVDVLDSVPTVLHWPSATQEGWLVEDINPLHLGLPERAAVAVALKRTRTTS